jgi:hypothetical protein
VVCARELPAVRNIAVESGLTAEGGTAEQSHWSAGKLAGCGGPFTARHGHRALVTYRPSLYLYDYDECKTMHTAPSDVPLTAMKLQRAVSL